MIKSLLRSIAINALGIIIATKISSGLIQFTGNAKTLFLTSLVIIFLNLLVKPLINLILLPLHIVTLGLFRWVANLIAFYLITVLIPQFTIHSYVSPPIDLGFILIPRVYFSSIGSYLLASLFLSLVFQFLYWLFSD